MAGPIAHVMLALSILPKLLPEQDAKTLILTDKNIKEFVLGSTFPDIRYITKNIKREDTHFKNITLEIVREKIRENKFFQAGVIFHSFVDELRDKYMNKKNVYKIMPRSENAVRAIKFLEDNILYKKIQNKNQVIKYFDTILDEELKFYTSEGCIYKSDVKNWHKLMQTYFEKEMDPQHRLVCYLLLKYPKIPKIIIKLIAYLAFWLKILPKNFVKIIEVIGECEKNERLIKIINNFYDNFEQVCQETY